VYQLRRWYEQFYTDIALVGDETRTRKHFDVCGAERA